MYRKLRYVSKRNKIIQLVVQVKYYVNASGVGTHAHTQTDFADKSNQARA